MHTEITRLLSYWDRSNRDAADALLGAVYGELRKLARSHLRRERRDHTLSATGLVHEAWLKLVGQREQTWQNRAHFFGAASNAMRRLLVDYARGRAASKRKGERVALTEVDEAISATPSIDQVLTIEGALERLSAVNDRLVRVVECRYYGGLTIPETAEALGVSHTTVSDDWRFARAWLRRALTAGSAGHAEV
jgi:RNA polymerase sigma factor (TIGR02999 family)